MGNFSYITPNILPHFTDVFILGASFLYSKNGIEAIIITTGKVFIGIFFAFVFGIIIAILLAEKRYIREIILPIFTAFQSAPPISWIIIAIMWFGITPIPPIIAIFITSIPIISITVYYSIKETNDKYSELYRIYHIPKRDRIRYIILPSVFSHIIGSMRIAIGFSYRIGITAEFFADKSGIGYYISWAYYNMNMSKVFAYTFIAIIMTGSISILTIKFLRKVEIFIAR